MCVGSILFFVKAYCVIADGKLSFSKSCIFRPHFLFKNEKKRSLNEYLISSAKKIAYILSMHIWCFPFNLFCIAICIHSWSLFWGNSWRAFHWLQLRAATEQCPEAEDMETLPTVSMPEWVAFCSIWWYLIIIRHDPLMWF